MRLLLLLFCLFCLPAAGQEGATLVHADLIRDEHPTAPAADDPRWQPVSLPDFWREEAHRGQMAGWYRLRYEGSRPAEPWGVLLWRLHMNAAVWFNGTFIGDGGTMEEPVARNWNRPLYFLVPDNLWRTGDNVVLIRLRASPGYALLAPPDIGPDRLLRPAYERRLFLQIDVSSALSLLLGACGLFMLALWRQRRNDAAYLWFGLSCLCWALLSAYLFVRDPPLRGDLFRWLAHGAADAWIACLALFTFRFLGERHRRLERLLLGLPALAALGGLACLDAPLQMFNLFRISHGASLLVGLGLTAYSLLRWHRDRRREAALLAGVMAVIVVCGGHDWVLELPYEWASAETRIAMMREQFFMIVYGAPLAFLFLAGHLVQRFARAMTELEILRDDLEDRVAAGRHALEASFQQQRALERSQAASEERERIYRDLHDDIGAKLLALVIGAETRLKADLARSALQDLRDVVSRSTRGDAPLTELCADWRSELEQRLADADIALDWHQPERLPDPLVKAGDALHMGRILREAVSNAMRHAAPSRVAVQVSMPEGPAPLEIVVENDGKAFTGMPERVGRGLRNMRYRADQLGGDILWERAGSTGCRVKLRVPRTRLDAAPA